MKHTWADFRYCLDAARHVSKKLVMRLRSCWPYVYWADERRSAADRGVQVTSSPPSHYCSALLSGLGALCGIFSAAGIRGRLTRSWSDCLLHRPRYHSLPVCHNHFQGDRPYRKHLRRRYWSYLRRRIHRKNRYCNMPPKKQQQNAPKNKVVVDKVCVSFMDWTKLEESN